MQDKASRRRDCFLFVAGGILGAVAFLLVLGLSPLDVTRDAFCRGGYIEKDIQQHYAGWLFYRESPLSFPLCIADSINWPDGLSVAFTDSIPLFAAFFRLLEPILPSSILAGIPCSVWFCRGQSVHGCWVCLRRDVGCLLRGICGLYSALFCGNGCCGILRWQPNFCCLARCITMF